MSPFKILLMSLMKMKSQLKMNKVNKKITKKRVKMIWMMSGTIKVIVNKKMKKIKRRKIIMRSYFRLMKKFKQVPLSLL